MFKKTEPEPKEFELSTIAGRIVSMFANEIMSLKGKPQGTRLEIWLGMDDLSAEAMMQLIPGYVRGITRNDYDKYFEVVLEKEDEEQKKYYHMYVVRK